MYRLGVPIHGIVFAIGVSTRVIAHEGPLMWNLFNCYLSGRHDYGMWCEPGQIYLRCVHCGKRSPGWSLDAKVSPATTQPHASVASTSLPARVLPFARVG
jgi:hypothetical protein